MKLSPIVIKLRLANTRFGNDIAGAAELGVVLDENNNIPIEKDTAFVIALGENATRNRMDITINQVVTETFGVYCFLPNDTTQKDKTGITAYDLLDNIRAELFTGILGWKMPIADVPNIVSVISYVGGEVIELNRAYLVYLYRFQFEIRIDSDDGVNEDINSLPTLDQVYSQYTDNLDALTLSGVEPKLPADDTDEGDITMITLNVPEE